MGTTATHMPPLSQAIVDPKTGLASINFALWQQELLRARQAWIPYTPTTANLTAITLNDCAFQVLGKLVTVRIGLGGTTDGVNRTTFTLPFKAKSVNQTFAAVVDPSVGGGSVSALSPIAADLLTITIVTLPAAGVHFFLISGAYEAG